MKVFKPQRLSLLTRVVEHERRCSLTVSVLAYVPMAAPRQLMAEAALWKDASEAIAIGVVDEATPKPCGEVLVSGSAFAPGGKPAGAVMLRVAVFRGDETLIDKKLAALGNRYWVGSEPSEPRAFAEMPIDLAHAFGGEGHAPNPHGKGFAPVTTEHGEVVPLPNVEDPKALIVSPKDRPEPASFGPFDVTTPQRMTRMGRRYDDTWLKKRFPGPAEDFDAHFYNVAPPDQWLSGFFDQTERLVVEGMHPDKPRVEMTLSPLVVRAFATQRGEDDPEERFVEIATRLDTIHLLPHLERAILIYRGTHRVAEDDADDIVHLMVAAEAPEAPKTLDHYRAALALRLDKDKGALALMRDKDLLPPPIEGWSPALDLGDLGELTKTDNRQLANAERGRKKKLGEARAQLEAAGFDVADAFAEPEIPAIPDPYDVDALMALQEELEARQQKEQAALAERKDAMEAKARKSFAAMGLDWDEEAKKAVESGGGPPDFSAERHLAMLQDMARIAREGNAPLPDLERDLEDPRYRQTLVELEAMARESYVKFAHLMPGAAVLGPEEAHLLRVRIITARDCGEPLTGQNLSGADLHDLNLSGIDLSDCVLDRANLRGADLSGARLRGVVLARADLTDTSFMDADLSGANLGGTRLERTDLSGTRLDETTFMRSELCDVRLLGARLRDTTFLETIFVDADFSHAELYQPLFLQCDLRRTSFTGADMEQPRFLEVDVRGVDFTGARMDKAQFLKCQGDGASFAGCSLREAVFVHETSFEDCDFAGADLTGANLRKTPLARSNFEQATLHRADVSGCDLRAANLHRIAAHEARMVRANLAEADLRGADLLGAFLAKARLFGTDLRGVNVSRADVSLIRTDGRTRLSEALMIDTRVDPQYEEPR